MRMLKQSLRTLLRSNRVKKSAAERQHYAEQITSLLFRTTLMQKARDVALYLAFDGEVPTDLILKNALTQNKSCYVPVLANSQLQFVKIEDSTPMSINRFGILEPSYPFMKKKPAHELDLVLVPLVAFDKDCHRLGMGAGFYDATFAFKRSASKPRLIGLAYDFQRVFSIPRSKYDIKLDGVITEKRLYLPTMLKR